MNIMTVLTLSLVKSSSPHLRHQAATTQQVNCLLISKIGYLIMPSHWKPSSNGWRLQTLTRSFLSKTAALAFVFMPQRWISQVTRLRIHPFQHRVQNLLQEFRDLYERSRRHVQPTPSNWSVTANHLISLSSQRLPSTETSSNLSALVGKSGAWQREKQFAPPPQLSSWLKFMLCWQQQQLDLVISACKHNCLHWGCIRYRQCQRCKCPCQPKIRQM